MLDLIIKNGKIIDGSGSDAIYGDIGIKNGKIVEIGKIDDTAVKVIDAEGLTVTPGFIDSHSHSDKAIFTHPEMKEKCEQGITTALGGQCGGSQISSAKNGEDIEDFFKRANESSLGSNLASFVGHGSIRRAVMGYENREPDEDELERMKELVRESVRRGAVGMSTGLIYNPGMFAKTDELIALSEVCVNEGGILSSHIRGESDTLIEAVDEFLSIVRATGARGVISHHKSCYPRNHGKVNQTLQMIDKINLEGYDVYCDVYPYTASATSVCARFIPKIYQADGKAVENVKDPKTRQKIIEYNESIYDISHIDWALITRCAGHPEYNGKYICEIAKMMGCSDIEAALNLIEISGNACSACFFSMCEEDVITVIKHPRSMICTDSSVATTDAPYHPRLRASFVKAIRRYVRELGAVTLPEMIRKMTSLPAHVYSLNSKGLIKVGYDADICIFDYERLTDKSDYADPFPKSEGLNYVIVSGEIVCEDGVYTGKRPGKFILHNN